MGRRKTASKIRAASSERDRFLLTVVGRNSTPEEKAVASLRLYIDSNGGKLKIKELRETVPGPPRSGIDTEAANALLSVTLWLMTAISLRSGDVIRNLADAIEQNVTRAAQIRSLLTKAYIVPRPPKRKPAGMDPKLWKQACYFLRAIPRPPTATVRQMKEMLAKKIGNAVTDKEIRDACKVIGLKPKSAPKGR